MSTSPEAGPGATPARIPVGVSSCLLGQEVRYDGGHKRDRFVTDSLGRHFDFVPICPEVGIGLGIPRPPIRLVGDTAAPRVVGVGDPALDVTGALTDYARRAAERCRKVSGYILKRGSPSCGMQGVKVYHPNGMPAGKGAGAYAHTLMAALPLLPVEDEGRLNDAVLRENFVTRVFVYHRWRELVEAGVTARALVDFHTRHKFLVLAHSERRYRLLGRLVAGAGRGEVGAVADEYAGHLMGALRLRATRKRHANVLQHLAGFLKRSVDAADKEELGRLVDEYRLGRVPLVVPIKMLRYFFRKHPDEYVAMQYYLDPHPEDLMLRNAL